MNLGRLAHIGERIARMVDCRHNEASICKRLGKIMVAKERSTVPVRNHNQG